MNFEFRIGKNSYKVESIKISDYYKIRTDLILGGKNAELLIVSSLTGCPISDLKKIPFNKWEDISLALEIMIKGAFKQNEKVVPHFRFKEVDYALIDFNKMTIGEFSDLDVIVTSENADYRLHEILAILYRPVIGKTWKGYKIAEYDIDGFEERSKLFLELPVNLAQSVSNFFLCIARVSTKAIKISSKLTKKQNPIVTKSQEILTMLQESGTLQSLDSQMKIHSKLTDLHSLAFEKLSTSWLIAKEESKNKKSWINKSTINITE